jgi:hypothetical protein
MSTRDSTSASHSIHGACDAPQGPPPPSLRLDSLARLLASRPGTANAWPVVVAQLHMHLGPRRTRRPALRRVAWAGETAKSTTAGRTWLGFHAPTTASSSISSTHFPGSTGANASRTARRSMRAMAPSLSEPTTVVSRAVLHCANPGHTEAVRGSWIRSPRPARGTRPPTAAPLAPQPPARSVRDARSAPTHAPP